ncbi:prepilin peptidase [Staphylococcus massiliensis]|uniref:Signal peptidase n=1 Tax=Staphylococcus massiliensis S46 TaxID=1229783 RepID=K9B8R2_9STAP|nr:A24 family peptidase [Staphylococcus massiliensis]EKU50170.1 signal peptidase [Staphylococcus massiliensis S46]MCG3399096.1 prepilin peptidase [Staphylococcus massiliensis]MCG3400906.1 prepilin peptidase [Staphylococcus massiliensis]POA01653.1 prepilin peptidase [Staphylococcus massiliensis CCUG 55927]
MYVLLILLSSLMFSFLYQLCFVVDLKFKYFTSRSKCDACRSTLRKRDLIPVVSYLLLKGRTHCCDKPLSRLYLVGEILIIACITLPSYIQVHFQTELYLLFIFFLLALSMYDIRSQMVPDHMLILLSILIIYFSPYVFEDIFIKVSIILGLHMLYAISRASIGYGDIKLLCVLLMGLPLYEFMMLFMFTFILGGIFALILMAFKRRKIKGVPLIPFVFAAFLFLNTYFEMINLYIGG